MSQMESVSYTTPTPLSPNTTVLVGNQSPSAVPGGKGMTFDQVMNTWIQAGGNPQAAEMAAAVADASSGLNPGATYTNPDGTTSIGLWLIPQNGTPPGSTDPIANARAAIQLSRNGADWSQWCTAWSDNNCGSDGGTYLGEGSNALGSIGRTGKYNMFGARPSGSGQPGGQVMGGSAPSGTGNTKAKPSSYLSILVVIALIVVVYFFMKRKTGNGEESSDRSQAGWTPGEEAMLSDSSKTDKQLSSETGRSVRAIRVRRNQLKSR